MIAGKYYEPGDEVSVIGTGSRAKVRTTMLHRDDPHTPVEVRYEIQFDVADPGSTLSGLTNQDLERVMVKGETIQCPKCKHEFGR